MLVLQFLFWELTRVDGKRIQGGCGLSNFAAGLELSCKVLQVRRVAVVKDAVGVRTQVLLEGGRGQDGLGGIQWGDGFVDV